MVKPRDCVISLDSIEKADEGIVGELAASLGYFASKKIPILPGFIITPHAFDTFLEENQLKSKIIHLVGSTNIDSKSSLEKTSVVIKKLINNGKIPELLLNELFKNYQALNRGNNHVFLKSSFAQEKFNLTFSSSQEEKFASIKGEAALIHKIREVWSCLVDLNSKFLKDKLTIDSFVNSISLVVQQAPSSDVSGIMFTADPVAFKKSRIVIEAVYGLSTYLAQADTPPDFYEVEKSELKILSKNISEQKQMHKGHGSNKKSSVPFSIRKKQKLNDNAIIDIANLGKKIESNCYFPQEIEWTREKNKFYIVNSKQISSFAENEKKLSLVPNGKEPILIGTPASAGIAIGKAVFIKNNKDLEKIKRGDVVIALFTTNEHILAIKNSCAILIEKGSISSHAATIARSLGKPAIIGIPKIFSKIKENSIISVNGKTGEVFSGSLLTKGTKMDQEVFKTATKVFCNIFDAQSSIRASELNVDGVGAINADYLISQFNMHPKKIIEAKMQNEFINVLSEEIALICKSFYPKPVFYKMSNLNTNEYMNLIGGRSFEKKEKIPNIGHKGAYRHIRDKSLLQMELRAIVNVREKMGLNNLNLTIPFVRTVKEVIEIKKVIDANGLKRGHTFKLYITADFPSNVILIDKFIDTGIDGVLINSNELTMLMLGLNYDNEEIINDHDHKEMDESLLNAYNQIIKAGHKKNIKISIYGQAVDNSMKLVDALVRQGIDSVCVSPSAVNRIRSVVQDSENSIVLNL